MRQADDLYPILINCVLEKVISELRENMNQYSTPNGIKLGHKKNELKFEYFAYADGIVFLCRAIKQIVLKEIGEK